MRYFVLLLIALMAHPRNDLRIGPTFGGENSDAARKASPVRGNTEAAIVRQGAQASVRDLFAGLLIQINRNLIGQM